MSKFKVLCIDDSKAIHAALKDMIRDLPIDLIQAFDGQEGIDKLLSLKSEERPQLILLDWEMPKKTGPEVLSEIMSNNIKIPVVMMTTKNEPEDISNMINAGAVEYILKPYTKDILIGKISEFLPGLSQ